MRAHLNTFIFYLKKVCFLLDHTAVYLAVSRELKLAFLKRDIICCSSTSREQALTGCAGLAKSPTISKKADINRCRGTTWIITTFTHSVFQVWSQGVQMMCEAIKTVQLQRMMSWNISSLTTGLNQARWNRGWILSSSLSDSSYVSKSRRKQILQETPHLYGLLSCGVFDGETTRSLPRIKDESGHWGFTLYNKCSNLIVYIVSRHVFLLFTWFSSVAS